jgi:hypothetical protein
MWKSKFLIFITSEGLFVVMNPFSMHFERIFKSKTFLANVAQVWLKFFVNTLNVFLKVCLVKSCMLTQITFEALFVCMNHFNVQFEGMFLTKALLTNFTLILL